jgi:RNA-directed DNA polymerase
VLTKANDGVTFAAVEAEGREQFLEQLRKELVERAYRPQKARKVEIPEDGGKKVRVLCCKAKPIPPR